MKTLAIIALLLTIDYYPAAELRGAVEAFNEGDTE